MYISRCPLEGVEADLVLRLAHFQVTAVLRLSNKLMFECSA